MPAPFLRSLFVVLLLTTTPTACAALSITHLKIGTRPSPLALKQADSVASTLRQTHPSLTVTIVPIASSSEHSGGKEDAPLAQSNVDFTDAIDEALMRGTVDVGVHSLKDVPPTPRWRDGLTIAMFLPRVAPTDVLLGPHTSLQSLPKKARIGSSALRRQAQLLAVRSDLQMVNLRGNVGSRLRALSEGEVDALVMARAGLDRLGLLLNDDTTALKWSELNPEDMVPGVGQGIVCATCCVNNLPVLGCLREADDGDSRVASTAERSALDVVDGSAPWVGRPAFAAYMERQGKGWRLNAMLARPDGCKVVRARRDAIALDVGVDDAERLGRELGEEVLREAGKDFYV